MPSRTSRRATSSSTITATTRTSSPAITAYRAKAPRKPPNEMNVEGPQGVTYSQVDEAYFTVRALRPYAGVFSLWAIGVGAVISGQYSGWNLGLGFGWGSMFVATVVVTIMFAALAFSIAEMAAALPHAGGAYSYARSAMGPWGGFVAGIAQNVEYTFTAAVLV